MAIPPLESAGRRLLDHLEWHGLAMVEFLWDESAREFELVEVNPRSWSSLPFVRDALDVAATFRNEQSRRRRG